MLTNWNSNKNSGTKQIDLLAKIVKIPLNTERIRDDNGEKEN